MISEHDVVLYVAIEGAGYFKISSTNIMCKKVKGIDIQQDGSGEKKNERNILRELKNATMRFRLPLSFCIRSKNIETRRCSKHGGGVAKERRVSK